LYQEGKGKGFGKKFVFVTSGPTEKGGEDREHIESRVDEIFSQNVAKGESRAGGEEESCITREF